MRIRVASVIVCVLAAGLVVPSIASAQRAIFLVRHGERADDSADTALSEAGVARAQKLATMLAEAGVTAVFATQFQRTLNTAKPLADVLKLPIARIDDTASRTLVTTLASKHAQDVVLVAAHSHTIPEIIKLLGYPTPITVAAQEFDNLFVILPQPQGPPLLLRLRY